MRFACTIYLKKYNLYVSTHSPETQIAASLYYFLDAWCMRKTANPYINRELKKYTGFRSYFLTESRKDKWLFRLNETFSKNVTDFYLMFFKAIFPVFTNFNKFLQTEESLIQCLHGEIQA